MTTIAAPSELLPTVPATSTTKAASRRKRSVPLSVWVFGSLAAALVVLAIIGPWIVGDVTAGHIESRLLAPGQDGHLLGTDGQGRDVLARLVAGTRPSMIAALAPVAVAALLGTIVGITAGMAGSRIHSLIMRSLDVLYAFPAVLLAIAISSSLGNGTLNTVIALSVVLIPPIARIAETETVGLHGMDFMESARASGAGRISIARYHVLPNVLPALVVYGTSLIGLALVFAGGLSFLGLGVAPPAPEWGQMLNEMRQYMYASPMIALVPAIVIFAASMVFNLLGDGLRDLLDIKRSDQ